jgi:hypothetical protein
VVAVEADAVFAADSLAVMSFIRERSFEEALAGAAAMAVVLSETNFMLAKAIVVL